MSMGVEGQDDCALGMTVADTFIAFGDTDSHQ
jgi:hypothetical protein